jgi:hypothetical protein
MTVGWLTVFEVLDETGLPYSRVMDLADRGLISSRSSGGAVLYDPADVTLLRFVGPPASECFGNAEVAS